MFSGVDRGHLFNSNLPTHHVITTCLPSRHTLQLARRGCSDHSKLTAAALPVPRHVLQMLAKQLSRRTFDVVHVVLVVDAVGRRAALDNARGVHLPIPPAAVHARARIQRQLHLPGLKKQCGHLRALDGQPRQDGGHKVTMHLLACMVAGRASLCVLAPSKQLRIERKGVLSDIRLQNALLKTLHIVAGNTVAGQPLDVQVQAAAHPLPFICKEQMLDPFMAVSVGFGGADSMFFYAFCLAS